MTLVNHSKTKYPVVCPKLSIPKATNIFPGKYKVRNEPKQIINLTKLKSQYSQTTTYTDHRPQKWNRFLANTTKFTIMLQKSEKLEAVRRRKGSNSSKHKNKKNLQLKLATNMRVVSFIFIYISCVAVFESRINYKQNSKQKTISLFSRHIGGNWEQNGTEPS